MMKPKKSPASIDGFSLRRRRAQPMVAGQAPAVDKKPVDKAIKAPRLVRSGDAISPSPQTIQSLGSSGLSRAEIDESLKSIDEQQPPAKKRRRFRLTKRGVKRGMIITGILLFLAIVAFVANFLVQWNRVNGGNIFDVVAPAKELKMDQYGRTNIVIFGTSEDDPGHPAGNLTDSIMMMSVDQKQKTAAMVSVPRDLWVKYGQACTSGYEGKINVMYQCGSNDGADQKAGAVAMQQKVGEIFGVDVHYYAQVNYAALRGAVDAVGGITVQIESDDPRGVYDTNFDWQCDYKCNLVKWPNGPAQLDGIHALALARARNAAGGYGLSGGNFDREKYQQKIIIAIRDKALSVGTLANPIAVNGLINTLGSNVRTDFDTAEIKTLATFAKDIQSTNIKQISLIEEGNSMVKTGNISGQSVVVPVAGTYDFSAIQAYIAAKLKSLSGEEEYTIDVLNGSGVAGVAAKQVAKLKEQGLDSVAGDAEAKNFQGTTWYDLSGGKLPKTAGKLQQVLGSAAAGTALPTGVQSEANFVIIVGNGAN